MDKEKYEGLKLKNQLCFPLYACAKEIVRMYKPFLEEIDLTYTQYITMLVLWEHGALNVKHLGECLFLDSGTLTPLLKKLEAKGYLERKRSREDERNLMVCITKKGEKLKERAVSIPQQMGSCVRLDTEEIMQLQRLLYKILGSVKK